MWQCLVALWCGIGQTSQQVCGPHSVDILWHTTVATRAPSAANKLLHQSGLGAGGFCGLIWRNPVNVLPE